MFKDYDKYLTTSIKVYLFVLIIIFILKMVGLDYFGIDIYNPLILKLESLSNNFHIQDAINFFLLVSQQYLMISMICMDDSKMMLLNSLCSY